MIKIRIVGLVFGILAVSIVQCFCQTNLQFTGVNTTPENAIQLYWSSTNGEIYQVQYANALGTNDDSSTAWQVLYDHYPSHGTSTFIGDFGNYDVEAVVPHPKYMPMRFYRLLDEGSNSAASPFVTITSPTNTAVLSGQITVSVVSTSSLPVLTTKLYVDGQEMDRSDDGSNYVINTCEWLNGTHTFFAVATARSGMSGPSGSYPITSGNAVSSYVPVTFSNLITGIAFSEPFFEPSLGQTQEVTAIFAANSDWTLQIQDGNSNAVRNATGSGTSMTFDWDGTGDGGTNIADGVYYYLLSAETNGLAPQGLMGGSGSSSFSSATSSLANRKELWGVPVSSSGDVGNPAPLAIYPVGFDTNTLVIVSASQAEVTPEMLSTSGIQSFGGGSFSPDYSGSSSQSAIAPTRPPTSPVKNAANNYAIGYYSWPNSQTVNIPKNGIPFPATGVCHLDGSGGSQVEFDNLPEAQTMSQNMEREMKRNGWKLGSIQGDQNLPVNSIRRSDQGYGGGEFFTAATVGLFLDHGDYGTDPDYNPGSSGSKQTYFRSDADSGDDGWLRMCQFGFGGNLKWMAILACNSVCDPNYSSMKNAGGIPLKTTHLICGCATIAAVGETVGADWTKNMLQKKQSIAVAWFNAGVSQYANTTVLSNSVVFRVVGYPECMDDTVNSNTAPTSPSSAPGNLTKDDLQVYP